VARELHGLVHGDERHRAAQEGAEGLVVNEPVDLLAEIGELLRIGLHNRAGHQLFELGQGRPSTEGAQRVEVLVVDHRRRIAGREVEPGVNQNVEGQRWSL
jgi:hypothetical protein